jgi:DNA polymerase-4
VKSEAPRRSILHVDLDALFVSVERSLDPRLRGVPVIVGGDGSVGVVAAASPEARDHGVRVGQALAEARRLCPGAAFRPGDLEAYSKVGEDVTGVLLTASRRVERPSADEAYVDLTPEGPLSENPVQATERIKDELQRRLGLDASFGLAASRLAARIASGRARPRGLLIVIPGYEASFLARQPVGALPDLPPHLEKALVAAGLTTLGDLEQADESALEAIVGRGIAQRLRAAARGEGEPAVPIATPPAWVQEATMVRDRRSNREDLRLLLEGLGFRATRRLRPFGLVAGTITVEVEKGSAAERRTESLQPAIGDEETICEVAARLATPLLEPASTVRAIHLRLSRLAPPDRQAALFPADPGAGGRRRRLV